MEKGLPLIYSSTHFSLSSFPHFYRVLVLHRKCVLEAESFSPFQGLGRLPLLLQCWGSCPQWPPVIQATEQPLTDQWPCTDSRSTQQQIARGLRSRSEFPFCRWEGSGSRSLTCLLTHKGRSKPGRFQVLAATLCMAQSAKFKNSGNVQ